MSARRRISLLSRSSEFRDQSRRQLLVRLGGEGELLRSCLLQQRSGFGKAALELGDNLWCAARVHLGARLGEDRAHHRRDERLRARRTRSMSDALVSYSGVGTRSKLDVTS